MGTKRDIPDSNYRSISPRFDKEFAAYREHNDALPYSSKDMQRLAPDTELVRPFPSTGVEPAKDVRPRRYEGERIRRVEDRPRVTTNLDPAQSVALEKLASSKGQTKSRVMRDAIEAWITTGGQKSIKSRSGKIIIRSVPQALLYSRLIVTAINEALAYDPRRHHNQPPPALRIEQADYLDEIRKLVGELQRLNQNIEKISLAQPSIDPKDTLVERSAIDVRRHLNTFLEKYASTLGSGAGVLTIGVLAALLYQLGLPETAFEQIIKKIR